MALRRAETPAIHANVVNSRIRFDPHLVDRVAVDRDATLLNQFFRCASRGQAGLGEDLLKPDT